MADLNHPIVTGMGLPSLTGPVIRGISTGVAALGRTAAHAAATQAAITAVDTVAGNGDNGVVSFNLDLSRDNNSVGNVSEMTTQDLANSLRIEPRPSILEMPQEEAAAFLQRDSDGTAVSNELLARIVLAEIEADTVRDMLRLKAEMSQPDDNAFASSVPDNILEAFASPELSSAVQEDNLTRENRSRISNRTLDGRRVSREYSEFQYCRSSGQIGSALSFLQLYDEGNVANVSEDFTGNGYGAQRLNVRGLAQDDISYGQFVDMVCFRRFIALSRGIRRKVRSANVTCVLSLTNPPTDPDILFVQILSGGDHTLVIDELNRTINQDVGLNTNQEACEATGGATRVINDRREQMEEFGSGGQGQI